MFETTACIGRQIVRWDESLKILRSLPRQGRYREAEFGADLLLCAAGPADVLPGFFDGNGKVILTSVAPGCGA
jgi:hypothetical protein